MADVKSKKRHRLNWIDFLIFIIILAVGVVIFTDFIPNESTHGLNEKTVRLEYTIQIDKLSSELDLTFSVGQPVSEIKSKEKIGDISVNPLVVAYQENVFNEDGEAIEIVQSDAYRTLQITLIAEAVETQYGYYVNNVRIAVGKDYSLRVAGLEADGTCIGIEVKEGE